jgi:hypothetical protein
MPSLAQWKGLRYKSSSAQFTIPSHKSINLSQNIFTMKTTTALLALAAAAEGSPLFSKRDDIFDDKEKFCGGWDFRTTEGVEKVWEETAAGVSLELFIKGHWGK